MKQFKARIEWANSNYHAMEIFFQGNSIIAAGTGLLEDFGPVGVKPENVVSLIDITPNPPKENTTDPTKPHKFIPKSRSAGYCQLCDTRESTLLHV